MNKPISSSILLAATLGSGTAAHAAVYSQNFTFANGTSNLGDGSALTTGVAPSVAATIQNNALELTSVANGGTQNSFNIPALANSALGFTASFTVTLIDTAGGNPPADGFSFNYGNFASTANYGEDGPGTGLSWIVDTWNNEVGDQGVRLRVNGVAGGFTQNFVPLADGATANLTVNLSWTPANGMGLNITGLSQPINVTNAATPGFTGNNANLFGFGARTGGATETVSIDNLVITTVPEPGAALLAAFAGMGMTLIRRRPAK